VRAPRRPRLWIHVVLLAGTALTATVFGSWFWTESFDEFGELWQRPDLALEGLPYAFWLLAILGAHEMGHYLACRRYGIQATLPYFLPGLPPLGTFGAVIRIRSVIPDRRALFDIAAAGPIAGFAVGLPVLLVGLSRAIPVSTPPEEGEMLVGAPLVSTLLSPFLLPEGEVFRPGALYGAAWVGMLVTSMNLFPVGQLDGGHAAYAISPRLHRALARLTLLFLFVLVISQVLFLRTIPAYTLWFAVLLFMRDRHPRLADEVRPLGGGRKAIAILLALIFLATFIPIPILLL
jgi:membrane-associated protease RseP (regulator of RpoE activity)